MSGDVDPALVDELRRLKTNFELCAIRDDLRDQTRQWWSECAPPAFHRAAEAILRVCCAELHVTPPRLRWFGPETVAETLYANRYGERDWPHFATDQPVRGAWQAVTATVWVSAHLDLGTTLATVAHEAAHAAGGDEEAARAYEERWAATLPTTN